MIHNVVDSLESNFRHLNNQKGLQWESSARTMIRNDVKEIKKEKSGKGKQ